MSELVQHLDTFRACADRRELLTLKVGRQRSLPGIRITTAEGLPSEIVFAQAETAHEFFKAVSQYIGHVAVAGECCVLRRRNAETVQRHFTRCRPPHEPLVKQRSDCNVEIVFLFVERTGAHQVGGIDAVDTRQSVTHAYEAAEQAVPVQVPSKQ